MLNKNVLISAILASVPTAQLTASDISNIKTKMTEEIPAVEKQVFLSYKTFVLDPEGDNYAVRLTLVNATADSYTFFDASKGEEGEDASLDFELIIDYVNLRTGDVLNDNMTRFAKNLGSGKMKAYFCDSTAVCSDVRGSSEVSIEENILTVDDASELDINGYFGPSLNGELKFYKFSK